MAALARSIERIKVARTNRRQIDDVKPMAVSMWPVKAVQGKAMQRRHRIIQPSQPGLERNRSPRAGDAGFEILCRVSEIEKGVHLGSFVDPIPEKRIAD